MKLPQKKEHPIGPKERQFLDKVAQKQGRTSDHSFARQVGIAHRTYGMTMKGEMRLGITFLAAIARHYQDLDNELLEYLAEEAKPEDWKRKKT